MDYEGRTCRAPMERGAFLLPVMVGCTHNKCKFCSLGKDLRYRVLPKEQVEKELKRVFDVGGRPAKIFFGDSNAFGLDTSYLIELLDMVHAYFPDCQSVNMDATVTSILAKTDEELDALYRKGVRGLYIGIESGLDDVLKFMEKDHGVDEAYRAIERLQKAGLAFNAHIMSGVAGAGRGIENAIATAEFLNNTHPQHICNTSMIITPNSDLWPDVIAGAFKCADEMEVLLEGRMLLSLLQPEQGKTIAFDWDDYDIQLRMFGKLPQDREKITARLDGAIRSYCEEEGLPVPDELREAVQMSA